MNTPPDALDDCLRRARDGDPDAFGPVVAACQARLRAFVARYVPRADWVDDIAQQTFVTAYQSLRAFTPGTDFAAWLRQIAYNHLRAELERANRRKRLERDHLAEVAAGELSRRLGPEPEAESVDALRSCLRLLSDNARGILREYYAEGMSLAEIGRRLGRSAESLKVSLFKIRARLKTCIEQKGAAIEPGAP